MASDETTQSTRDLENVIHDEPLRDASAETASRRDQRIIHIIDGHETQSKTPPKTRSTGIRWICVDASPEKDALSGCSKCMDQKTYHVDYNCAAHLRRTHFNPRLEETNIPKPQGSTGGRLPTMEYFKKAGWMQELMVGESIATPSNEPHSVSVLLVGWKDDEPSVLAEIVELQRVFEAQFNFCTRRVLFPSGIDSEYLAINIISSSLDQWKTRGRLRIVYYNSHFLRSRRQQPGQYQSGFAVFPTVRKNEDNAASTRRNEQSVSSAWLRLDSLCRRETYETLMFFDHCHSFFSSPNLFASLSGGRREMIAACDNHSTERQSNASFTFLLSDTLRKVGAEDPIPTDALYAVLVTRFCDALPSHLGGGESARYLTDAPIHVRNNASDKRPILMARVPMSLANISEMAGTKKRRGVEDLRSFVAHGRSILASGALERGLDLNSPEEMNHNRRVAVEPRMLQKPMQDDVVKGIVEDCGLKGLHTVFTKKDDVPFNVIGDLGSGQNHVTKVESKINGNIFACKVFRLQAHTKELHLALIHQEANLVKGLAHPHIITINGTYEAPRIFGVIMSPVGDHALDGYLEETQKQSYPIAQRCLLSQWMLCLARAIDYIHSQGIKHRDIKPENVICKGDRIFLTDFGSATQFDLSNSSSTEGWIHGNTKMYSAPEVLSEARRGRSADIFSLGCVFAEMYTVISRHMLEDFFRFRQDGSGLHLYSRTTDKVATWFADIDPQGGNFGSAVIMPMLKHERHARPLIGEIITDLKGRIHTLAQTPDQDPGGFNDDFECEYCGSGLLPREESLTGASFQMQLS